VPLAYSQVDGTAAQIRTIFPTFTTIDVPGAAYTEPAAINTAGDIVGSFGQNTSSDSTGFLLKNGAFTFFSYPGENITSAYGINDSDVIVGHAGQFPVVGFLYDGVKFTTLQDGADSATVATGINNAGVVVGGAGTIYTTKGFMMRNDQYRTINFPGSYVYAQAEAINNFGQIVGYELEGLNDYGYTFMNGKFRHVAVGGAVQTIAFGINDSGTIVGWYTRSGPCTALDCAFVLVNGIYYSFTYPGAMDTFASGINNAGQIVGNYTIDGVSLHGFVTDTIFSPETAGGPHLPAACSDPRGAPLLAVFEKWLSACTITFPARESSS